MIMVEEGPLSIAIIGAGIAGITLAIALSKHNPSLKLTIYESRPQFSEIGAGVGFGPNAVQAMQLISPDIAAAYYKVATPNLWPEKGHVWFDIRYGDGELAGEFIGEVATGRGFTHSGASRAGFLDGLVQLIPGNVKVVFGKRFTNVLKEVSGMRVCFEDGEEILADAVVGCDGIRSVCRRIMLGEDEYAARAVYSGKYAYRKVVSMEKAIGAAGREVENRTIYTGKGGHLLTFPINSGKALNMVIFKDANGKTWDNRQWVIPSSREALLKDFQGWGDKIMRLLELVDEPEVWALFDHPPASTYTKDEFCLVGDAAHATTPHCGAGAGFAIEDAHLLSGLLIPDLIKSKADIKYAFKVYDQIRRPRSQDLVRISRQNGMFLDLQAIDGEDVAATGVKTYLEETMKWVWNIDLEAMLAEARELYWQLSTVVGN